MSAGETYETAALRELYEELGVTTRLTAVGKFYSDVDHEFMTIFIGHHDGPFTLEEASIEQAKWYSLDEWKNSPSMLRTSYLDKAIPFVEDASK